MEPESAGSKPLQIQTVTGVPRPRRLRGAQRVPGIPVGWHLLLEELAAALLRPLVCTHWLVTCWRCGGVTTRPSVTPAHLLPCAIARVPSPCVPSLHLRGQGGVLAGPSPSNSPRECGSTPRTPPQHLWGSSRSWTPTRDPPHPQGPLPSGEGGAQGEQSLFGELCGLCLCLSISPATRGGRS